jgi:hypothetical protein
MTLPTRAPIGPSKVKPIIPPTIPPIKLIFS